MKVKENSVFDIEIISKGLLYKFVAQEIGGTSEFKFKLVDWFVPLELIDTSIKYDIRFSKYLFDMSNDEPINFGKQTINLESMNVKIDMENGVLEVNKLN